MIEFLEEHMLQCPSVEYLGLHCPGCGFQRALIMLLQGNLTESFLMYPPLIPMMLMLLFLMIHLVRRYKYGHKVLMYLFILNVGLSIFNFINKF